MSHEIRLYDTIGGWGGISAEDIAAAIPAGETEITVRINSPGGDVSDGLAMYHYLKDHAASVTTIVDGYAASAASVVMLAGDEVRVHRSSLVMIHNPWTIAMGDADEMRHTADTLDEHALALVDIYKTKTGKSEDDLRALMKDETWMRGEAAVENGFADSLVEDKQEEQGRAAAHIAFASMLARLQNGAELMSRQKTRKDIEGERDEVAAELQAKTEECEAALAQVGVLAGDADTAQARIAELGAQVEENKAAAQQKVDEANARADAAESDRDDEEARAVAAISESKALQNRLALSPISDAELGDAEAVARAQIDAEADEAEAQALKDAEEAARTDAATYEKWQAISNAGEKRQYYIDNRDAIIADIDGE